MARRLSLLFSLPVGMRTTRDGISELQFSIVPKGAFNFVGAVGVSPGGGGREEFPQALRGRGRTEWVPWRQARRQEQGSRRWTGPAAAVGLAAGS